MFVDSVSNNNIIKLINGLISINQYLHYSLFHV